MMHFSSYVVKTWCRISIAKKLLKFVGDMTNIWSHFRNINELNQYIMPLLKVKTLKGVQSNKVIKVL